MAFTVQNRAQNLREEWLGKCREVWLLAISICRGWWVMTLGELMGANVAVAVRLHVAMPLVPCWQQVRCPKSSMTFIFNFLHVSRSRTARNGLDAETLTLQQWQENRGLEKDTGLMNQMGQ
jgi:hypothetical protein